jgi:cell division septal protein FtsQ
MLKGDRLIYLNRRGKKKKIKKDYHSKSLNNPFFRSKKKDKDKVKSKKRFIPIGFILLFIVAIIYIIFFSSYFQIKNIEVNGLSRVDNYPLLTIVDEQMNSKRWLFFSERNLLIFDATDLEYNIQDKLKLDSIKISKNLPNTLTIEVEERKVAFVWQESETYLFSDSSGCIIREPLLEDELLLEYPILTNDLGLNYLNNLDCIDLDLSYFDAMFNLYDQLKQYAEIDFLNFVLSEERNSLTVDLELGPKVIFNTKEDLLKQVNKLLAIKSEQKEEDFLALEYIDLRFGDLIYFK